MDDGAISPDGQRFVFSASVDGGHGQLVLRDLASTELRVIPGTRRAYRPFWSPDSRSIAFFLRSGQLGKVLVGEPARVLVDSPPTTYEDRATWAPGVILFGPREGRIHRLAEAGGTASGLETLPWKPGQASFMSPRFLPDGRHFLVNMMGDPASYLASIDAPGIRKILDDASSVAYGAGHLVYSRGEALFACPFDAERLEVSGPEVLVTARAATFSVSDRGAIVYRPEAVSPSRLTWFDRSGRRVATVGPPAPYEQLVLSPGGRRAAVVRTDAQSNTDLWAVDLTTGISTRLTLHAARDDDPSWSPDEQALAFTSRRTGRAAVFVKDLPSGQESPLFAFDKAVVVDQWTPDGRFVIFRTQGKEVYAMPLSGDRTPRLLADTPYSEDEVHVSVDGRWVAFNSDESGQWEVYVATFPAFTSKKQVSSGGGAQPQWRADGRELFYLAPDGSMMSVRLDGKDNTPVRLFPTNIAPDLNLPQYAVTADGQRFLGLEPVAGVPSFTFLLNRLGAQSR